MRNKYLLPLALTVCLPLMGCGGKEAALVGKWTATDVKIPKNPTYEKMLKPKLSNAILELQADKHFTLTGEAGNWALQSGKVVLTVGSINGKPISDVKKELEGKAKGKMTADQSKAFDALTNQTATISPDSKTLSLPMKGGMLGDMTIVFTKNPA